LKKLYIKFISINYNILKIKNVGRAHAPTWAWASKENGLACCSAVIMENVKKYTRHI
jgi:hypothetical protein